VLALAVLGFALAGPLAAQYKAGSTRYESPELGFRVAVPDGWQFIPPQPGEQNVLAKYVPKNQVPLVISSKSMSAIESAAYVLRFDKRKAAKGEGKRASGDKDVAAWIRGSLFSGLSEIAKDRKQLDFGGVPAVEHRFKGPLGDGEVGVFATVYSLPSGIDVALAIPTAGDDKRWSKDVLDFRRLAKTFKAIDVVAAKEIVAAGDTLRDKKRAELQRTATQGGWRLYESANYFVVSNNDDKDFIAELMDRLEAIRRVYEADYPFERAKELRGKAPTTGDDRGDEPDGGDGDDEGEGDELEDGKPAVVRPPEAPAVDPVEASRCSVVRVCTSRDQYMSYGGPPGSAGYWNFVQQELVVYDDKAVGGRRDTWATLNHEAFHQYIFYLYGNISPHSWYNEGTGDFYSGYQYQRNKTFSLEKFDWRVGTIQRAVNEGKFVPLAEFVRMSQKEYYSKNEKHGTDVGIHYAQGWSLIWFLRTGKKANARGWNPRWDTILDDYFEHLAMTGKLDKAVEMTFRDVDMQELQAAWLAYTK
jgi:hypothetical protein